MMEGGGAMPVPTLGNPQNTIEILKKYNFSFQKKFGQNFLIDTRVLDKIIAAADITRDDFVLEIGPGIGTMTQYLAAAAGKVTAVEIDKALIPILADTLKDYDNVNIVNQDILKMDIQRLVDEENGAFHSIAVVDTVMFWRITNALYQAGYYDAPDSAPTLLTANVNLGDVPLINELWSALGSVGLTEGRYTDWDLDRSAFEASADSFDGEGWRGDVHVTYELAREYLSDWSWLADRPFSAECSECGDSTWGPV